MTKPSILFHEITITHSSLSLGGLNIVHSSLHGGNLLRLVIGNLDLESFLNGHDELDGIEGIGSEVRCEGGVWLDGCLVAAELLDDDLLDAVLDLAEEGGGEGSGGGGGGDGCECGCGCEEGSEDYGLVHDCIEGYIIILYKEC